MSLAFSKFPGYSSARLESCSNQISTNSAGIRDSPLTAHGVLQAKRLATYLKVRSSTIGPVQYIFSSDLQRAADTAQAIIDAQASPSTHTGPPSTIPLVKVADLRERNFGSAEGKQFGAPRDDAETPEEMRMRAGQFISDHIDPLLNALVCGVKPAAPIVIVSHGILLNFLVEDLLIRYNGKGLNRMPTAGQSGFIASWSNTGYVEAVIETKKLSPGSPSPGLELSRSSMPASPFVPVVTISVARVNAIDHLDGLKKTRGGIGSAQFDNRQRTLDKFLGTVPKDQQGGPS